jgi:transposase
VPDDLLLFPDDDVAAPPATVAQPEAAAAPRVLTPNRTQLLLRPLDLESLVPHDHRVRAVWDFVLGADLHELYDAIKAREGAVGRAATDPRLLLALWLYATVEGVGSARALARLCREHHAYQWLCGGVPTNYHTLADFRVAHSALLERLLTASVATLMAAGLVEVKRVAQDGMRVRASAGAASFRRKATLEKYLAKAEAQVAALRGELHADPGAATRREQAARERAARERQERVAAALAQLPAIEAKKKTAADKDKARASTTDPEARVMKMADGGFRPAYNAQFATDTATQVIVGVDVTNQGTDQGQLEPMVAQIAERCGKRPDEHLADGGFVAKDDIEQVSAGGTTVYVPVPEPRDPKRDPHCPLPDDSPVLAAWRVRMGTDDAKAIYKDRAATAECVNALARERGLQRLRVRGRTKVLAVLLWYALAHNLLRIVALTAVSAAAMT